MSISDQLHRIYQQHCPDKLGNVSALLAKFAGREAELLAKVQRKYGC